MEVFMLSSLVGSLASFKHLQHLVEKTSGVTEEVHDVVAINSWRGVPAELRRRWAGLDLIGAQEHHRFGIFGRRQGSAW